MFLETGDEFLIVVWDWKAQMKPKEEQEAYDLGMNYSNMVENTWSDCFARVFCTKKITAEEAQKLWDFHETYQIKGCMGETNICDIIEELNTQSHYKVVNGDLEYDPNATPEVDEGVEESVEIEEERPEIHKHRDAENGSDFLKSRGQKRWQKMLDFVKKQGFDDPESVISEFHLDDIGDFESAMDFYFNRIPSHFVYMETYGSQIEIQMVEKNRIEKIIAEYIIKGLSLSMDDIVIYDLDEKKIVNWEVKNIDVLVE